MNALRAVGVHMPYAGVPTAVRAWVDDALGSPVVSWADQQGGMSPGCVTRVVGADGSRAFVKAVGAELNVDTPSLFRREIETLCLIGSNPLWAGLRASYDDGQWVALLLDDVDGRHPHLVDDGEMSLLLDSTDRLTHALSEMAVPGDRSATMGGHGPIDVRGVFARWATAFDHLDEIPGDALPAWVRREAGPLQELMRAIAEPGDEQLVHWDIRNDNLLLRPTGELVFVDWGVCGVGPGWVDALLARLERVESPWFDESVRSSPALAAAGDDAVTAWLVGFGTHLIWRAQTAVDLNLPAMAQFRRTESRRCLAGARRRWDG